MSYILGGARVCEHSRMSDGVCTMRVVDRPSGPPDCVSTIATVSRILSRISDCFGLVAAAGKGW